MTVGGSRGVLAKASSCAWTFRRRLHRKKATRMMADKNMSEKTTPIIIACVFLVVGDTDAATGVAVEEGDTDAVRDAK